MGTWFKHVVGAALLLGAAMAQASIVYSVNRAIGAGSVTGFFETDGTIGSLGSANFVDWSLTIQSPDINGGASSTSSLAGGGSLFISGSLSATATDILFDFGSSDLFFTYTTTGDFWCVAGNSGGCFIGNAEVIGYSDTTNNQAESTSYRGVQSIAGGNAVPEPASIALFLLAGGAAALSSRRRKA